VEKEGTNIMAHLSRYITDRKLEDRAFLEFFFPKRERKRNFYSFNQKITIKNLSNTTPPSNEDYFNRVKLPFFENPEITESKSSRLGKYKVIGRNSDLYSYLGSDSRSITLSFLMTLPNLYEYSQLNLTQYKRTGFFSYERDPEAEKKRFKEVADLFPPLEKDFKSKMLKTIKEYEDTLLNSLNNTTGFEVVTLLGETISQLREATSFLSLSSDRKDAQRIEQTKVKALYYFWINVVRSSTMGSTKGGEGPPIIKLTFGPMYQRVPFIATRYNIAIDNSAGYDKLTLLPHRIKITLSLEEFRVGNFGDYTPISNDSDGFVEIQSSENVAGWDSILTLGTTDPRIVPPGFGEGDQEP
jgi:hypothetical protein